MKKLFKKFSGKIANEEIFTIESKEFIYCLIQLSIENYLIQTDKISTIISKLFNIIEQTGGDINQMFCDSILALYGVPLYDENVFLNIQKLLSFLTDMEEKIKISIGIDNGLYGAFGIEKRRIVTGVSTKLIQDYHRLILTSENKIFIHKKLAKQLKNIQETEKIIFI